MNMKDVSQKTAPLCETDQNTQPSMADIAEDFAVSHGAKTNEELLSMIEDIKETQFTPEEKKQRSEILKKIDTLTKENENMLKERARLANSYSPSASDLNKIQGLTSKRNANKREIEQLKERYQRVSAGHIKRTPEHEEIRKQIDFYSKANEGVEINIQNLMASGNGYLVDKAVEQEELLPKYQEILAELQEKEKQFTPEITMDIRQKEEAFRKENRKALLLKLYELFRQIGAEVEQARRAELDVMRHRREFLNSGMTFPANTDSYDELFIKSFYSPLGAKSNAEWYLNEAKVYEGKGVYDK